MDNQKQTKAPQLTEAQEYLDTTPRDSEPAGAYQAAPDAEAGIAHPGVPAAGPRPMFHLPFLYGQEWLAFTRSDHHPNSHSLDMTKVGGDTNGQPILASAAGQVVRVSDHPEAGGGWFVRIDHGNGWQTRYLHMLERPPVGNGQHVAQGQVIGRVGSTGHSSGPHLHYEQIQDRVTVRAAFAGVLVTVDTGQSQRLLSQNHHANWQNNWRWCEKCEGLFFYSHPDNGVCPAGGAHTAAGSGDYTLWQTPHSN